MTDTTEAVQMDGNASNTSQEEGQLAQRRQRMMDRQSGFFVPGHSEAAIEARLSARLAANA